MVTDRIGPKVAKPASGRTVTKTSIALVELIELVELGGLRLFERLSALLVLSKPRLFDNAPMLSFFTFKFRKCRSSHVWFSCGRDRRRPEGDHTFRPSLPRRWLAPTFCPATPP